MKLPVSVLVVVHTRDLEVLLLQRAARAEFWQSVTGSLDRPDEPLAAAAARELREETGIDAGRGRLSRWNVAYTFEIYARWRHRFAPGVTHNTEHLFSLELAQPPPVTLAPQEHSAFQWLPWREAARKCFSWSNRDAILMIGAALVSAGCATSSPPGLAAHLESAPAEVRECAQWYQALDAEIDAAGARDAQYARMPGFPHLRVDRLHASLRDRAAQDSAALRVFAERLVELDLESRRYEIQNHSALSDGAREELLRRLRDCATRLRRTDLASADGRSALLAAAHVPEDEPPARAWSDEARAAHSDGRISGGNFVRYSPPVAPQVPRDVVSGLLTRAALEPLGHPALTARELDRIAAAYAPAFEIEVGGDHDRFGRLRWGRAAPGGAPDLDAAQPTVYVQAAYARYGEHVLLQLVYTIWFAGPFDGLIWRVTLAPDGEPLVYDSVHAGGSFHVFYPTPRARPKPSSDAAAFVPHALPRVQEGERAVVSVASGTHYVRRVTLERNADSLVRYAFRGYDELRSLPGAGARHAGIFNPAGLIAGTTMRQWGKQATAPGRHFDDADVLERRFELHL